MTQRIRVLETDDYVISKGMARYLQERIEKVLALLRWEKTLQIVEEDIQG